MDDRARQWHQQHRMPKNPTAQQRVQWHIDHAQNCRCRPIPESVLALMRDQGREPPPDREPG